MTQALESSDKDFKYLNVEMLQQEIVNTYEMNIENFSIEIEYIERNQLEILELKNRVTKTSNQI